MSILIALGYGRPEDNEVARNLGSPDLLLKPDTIEDLSGKFNDLYPRLFSRLWLGVGKRGEHRNY